ncbi:polygalacturonase-like [Phragmites australis]|uniref:polygalacturonase-like n=1 Tax=Phragmites australis TaxID=29695 RepID=UPI002D7896C1|nr:polygalacturonase-like [Phragmites australis]
MAAAARKGGPPCVPLCELPLSERAQMRLHLPEVDVLWPIINEVEKAFREIEHEGHQPSSSPIVAPDTHRPGCDPNPLGRGSDPSTRGLVAIVGSSSTSGAGQQEVDLQHPDPTRQDLALRDQTRTCQMHDRRSGKPDDQTDSSDTFAVAWSASYRSLEPATLYVLKGDFFTRPSFTRMTIQIDGTLVAPSRYTNRGGDEWIVLDHPDGLTVSGSPVDGCSGPLWACKAARHGGCPSGATSLTVLNSRDVVISSSQKYVNSELYHIVIDACEGLTVHDVEIITPGNSPNTDGIHVQASSQVTVTQASIQTGDLNTSHFC